MKPHLGETPLGCLLGIAAIILALGIATYLEKLVTQ